MKKVGVLQFPGSNCDEDVRKAIKNSEFVFYNDRFDFNKYKALVVPGGFSYGDYLRSGALAARSPAMKDVRDAALKGWPVLGICNGFQILCEASLLEGTLLTNSNLRFIDRWVDLKLKTENKYWKSSSRFSLPIAHGEGRYFISKEGLKKLEDQNQIWLLYKDNPNGSLGNIAGVTNPLGNVAGLMPHPERAVASWMGGQAGVDFFKNIGVAE